MSDRIEAFFYRYMYGEWESLSRGLWIYAHVSILLATALVGFTVAHGEYLMTALLIPFPIVYLYKRYEKAQTYTVQPETSVRSGPEEDA